MKPVTSKLSFRTCSPGSYNNPICVVAFNVTERWSEDVSADVAHELRRRCDLQVRDVPFTCRSFTDRYEGRYHDVQLPLPMPGWRQVLQAFVVAAVIVVDFCLIFAPWGYDEPEILRSSSR
jgi:hypothetical protein